jgi:hypothetical protein
MFTATPQQSHRKERRSALEGSADMRVRAALPANTPHTNALPRDDEGAELVRKCRN